MIIVLYDAVLRHLPPRGCRWGTVHLFVCAVMCLVAAPASAESIRLKTGLSVEGEIITKTPEYIKVQTGKGVVRIRFIFIDDAVVGQYKAMADFGQASEPAAVPVQTALPMTAPPDVPGVEQPVRTDSMAPAAISPETQIPPAPPEVPADREYSNPKYNIKFSHSERLEIVDDPADPQLASFSKTQKELFCLGRISKQAVILIFFIPLDPASVGYPPEVLYKDYWDAGTFQKIVGAKGIVTRPQMISLGGRSVLHYQLSDQQDGLTLYDGVYLWTQGPAQYLFLVTDEPQYFAETTSLLEHVIATSATLGTASPGSPSGDGTGHSFAQEARQIAIFDVIPALIFVVGWIIYRMRMKAAEARLKAVPASIPVYCTCGMVYHFKMDLAGRFVQCRHCGREFYVPRHETGAPEKLAEGAAISGLDPVFRRNRYLMNQKVAVTEKYYTLDDAQQRLLYVERPIRARNLAAMLLALIVLVAGFILSFWAFVTFSDLSTGLGITAFVVVLALSVAAATWIPIHLFERKHVHFFRDETKQEKIMDVLQMQKFALRRATFAVYAGGELIAVLGRPLFRSLVRRTWDIMTPDGRQVLYRAREDSFILALLRRLIPLSIMNWALPTNFVITQSGSDQVVGEFNRKLTILDKYVLDLTADAACRLDRRIAVALAVLLDTGEGR